MNPLTLAVVVESDLETRLPIGVAVPPILAIESAADRGERQAAGVMYVGEMVDDPLLHRQRIKDRTPERADRRHRGPGHWHVRVRTNVIICRACGASIPKWKNPQYCPECRAGSEADGAVP